HPDQEAVRALASGDRRLESAFHVEYPKSSVPPPPGIWPETKRQCGKSLRLQPIAGRPVNGGVVRTRRAEDNLQSAPTRNSGGTSTDRSPTGPNRLHRDA